MATLPLGYRSKLAALSAAAAGAMLLGFAVTCHQVRAISVPQTFTVTQGVAGPTVAPGDTVTYTIAFTANATTGVGDLILTGNLGPHLTAATFGAPYGAACTTNGDASVFTCDLNNVSANVTVADLVVSATVDNVFDGAGIDLAPGDFRAKDSAFDVGVIPTDFDPPGLTIQNESVIIDQSASAGAIPGGTTVLFTIDLSNVGSQATGAYTVTATLAGGTVENVTCPSVNPGSGNGTSVASCAGQTSLVAGGGAGQMTVVARANVGATSLQSNVALGGGLLFTPDPASVTVTSATTGTATNTATNAPTNTSTSTPTPTSTGTATSTPTKTATPTATGTPTPAPSAELSILPGDGAIVSRSRLAFTVNDGSLSPTEVRLVIERTSDGHYWDAEQESWGEERIENPMSDAQDGSWMLSITGDARRLFVNTTLQLEARATVSGGSIQYSEVTPQVHVR